MLAPWTLLSGLSMNASHIQDFSSHFENFRTYMLNGWTHHWILYSFVTHNLYLTVMTFPLKLKSNFNASLIKVSKLFLKKWISLRPCNMSAWIVILIKGHVVLTETHSSFLFVLNPIKVLAAGHGQVNTLYFSGLPSSLQITLSSGFCHGVVYLMYLQHPGLLSVT